MNSLVLKAEKKAVLALKKEIKARNLGKSLDNNVVRKQMKAWYLRRLWKLTYDLAADKFCHDGSRTAALTDIAAVLKTLPDGKCTVGETPAWLHVKLANHAYLVTESNGSLYITATGMATFPVRMTPEDLVALIEAFDSYLGTTDVEQLFEKAVLEYHAEEKSMEILTLTARSLIQDLLKVCDVKFEVRKQKNSRLCCTIFNPASWMPNKVFRTSFETFPEDFIAAYRDFKLRDSNLYL